MKNDFKVMTYNIHKGVQQFSSRFVLDEIRKELRELDADLVLLQEIVGDSKTFKESQFEFIADSIWPYHAYGKNAVYQEGHHGNAILSKYEIETWEHVKLTLPNVYNRSLLHIKIRFSPRFPSLHVVCVHLGLLERERRMQTATLNTWLTESIPLDAPLILAGDFNDWRGNIDGYLEKELGLKEAFQQHNGQHARTFPAIYPVFPLDRVYYRGLKTESCKCFHSRPWTKLSDHLPLYVEFSLP